LRVIQLRITGRDFFSVTHNPRTLFRKGFGYFQACHQDLPRPSPPLVKFSDEVPAVSYPHQRGLAAGPATASSSPSPAATLAGARGRAVEGPHHGLLPWPRRWPPSFCRPLRNTVCGCSCLHCNSTRLLFLQEP